MRDIVAEFRAFRQLQADRGADLLTVLASWSGIPRPEIVACLAKVEPDVAGVQLYKIGLLAHDVHDLGKTDGRLEALDRATRKLKLERARWRSLLDGADRAPLESAEARTLEIGRILKEVMPPGWGYFLILSSFEKDGFMTYLSSVKRDGAIKLLRELADKFEKDPAGK